jgi:hypothetical protein
LTHSNAGSSQERAPMSVIRGRRSANDPTLGRLLVGAGLLLDLAVALRRDALSYAIVPPSRKTHHLAVRCIPRSMAILGGTGTIHIRPRRIRIPAMIDRRNCVGLRPHSKAARKRAYFGAMVAPSSSCKPRFWSPRRLRALTTHEADPSSAGTANQQSQDPRSSAQ